MHIIDKRDNDTIEYLAFPDDYIDEVEGEIDVPKFDVVEEEGFDRKKHVYMSVLWKDPKNATTKRYDVADHIVVAGCEARVDTDGKKMQCKRKELFVVLHPIDEWKDHHIVEL